MASASVRALPLRELLVGKFPKGIDATTRNWTSVTALAAMAND